MILLNDIKYLEYEVVNNYKYLHQIPEPGFREYNTHNYIMKKLDEYGIKAKKIAITGIIADIVGTKPSDAPKKTIAIRADIDALPFSEKLDVEYASKNEGYMHACGHDAHTSMLLGAAKYFAEHKSEFSGTVRLMFQPAEEGMGPDVIKEFIASDNSLEGGAAIMAKTGALDGVDMCYGLHVYPDGPIGSIVTFKTEATASSDKFTLTIKGKGGHGSAPHLSIDPLAAFAAVYNAYSQVPAREISALETCVVTIGTVNTNSSWNIIPDSVEITGGVRTFNDELREKIMSRLSEIATKICEGYGCKADFQRTKYCSPTINDENVSKRMVKIANEIFGNERAILLDKPMTGSEDIGEFFKVVPGAIAFLGVKKEGDPPTALHSPFFKLNLEALIYGVLYHVNMVYDLMEN